jgi:hypothetical protein
MKPMKTIPFLVLLVFSSHLVLSQEKYSTVKIYAPAERMQRSALIGLLQIDHFQETPDGAIISEISSGDIAKLKTTRYRYEIIIDDMVADLERANKKYYTDLTTGKLAVEQPGSVVDAIIRKPDAFVVQSTFGGYYSFAQMEAAMTTLVNTYGSALVQRTSLGRTQENRDIWCIKISDNAASDEEDEPEVLFIGVQHAREAIGGSSMIFFMQYLCEEYQKGNTQIRDLVNNREIYIIPCMNPDGWEYNRMNGGAGSGWRKNRSGTGSIRGVDLNRNWKYNWGNCGRPISGVAESCGTDDPTSDTYYGTAAFSELETRAIRDFTLSHHLTAMIDQHCYGPYYSLPFGRPSLTSNVMSAPDRRFYTHIASSMGNYNGMRSGNSLEALGYEVAGGVKDWMLKGDSGVGTKRKVYGLTGEGGGGGFWAPAGRIISLCKGMLFQNLQLLYAAGSYVNLQDRSEINILSRNGSFDFHMIRTGLENRPVTITAVPIENITITSEPVIVNSLTDYGSTYTGAMSYQVPTSVAPGQRIRFAWKIETGGYTWSDTVTKLLSSTEVFSDNMETGAVTGKWTVTGGWNYTTEDAFAGSRSLTESPGGDYSANSTRRATYSTLNLDNATSAYLSFWVKHRAENFYDKLQVQISVDASASVWTPINGTTTIKEPGTADGSTLNGQPALTGIKEDWTREIYDLSAYAGQPVVRLRFEFTSGPTSEYAFSEDDGFHIDNIKVVKNTPVPLVTLPVHFISFRGQLLPDQTVRLEWEAVTDDLHDYFDVERSANGSDFISIGRGPSSAPYWKIDPSPVPGNNVYRIKQFDKDGRVTYSTTINIKYDPPFSVSVYPNPFYDVLNIKINSSVPDRYTISLVDISGRKVHEEKLMVNGSSTRNLNIYMKQDAAQIFILMIRNGKNEIVSTQKITKE